MSLLLESPRPAISELPLPVIRWLEVAWPDGVDAIETITTSGPVRLRLGRLRLAGETTMRFRLGVGYVNDIRAAAGPLTVKRGLDALVDGIGITVIGSTPSTGWEIDQATFLALWGQSLLFPSAWERLPGLRWTPVDDEEVIVSLPFHGGIETATLRFDPDRSPFPVAFEAERFRAIGRPKVTWRSEYGEWHWRDGIAVPTRLRVRWADQPAPWFEMRVEDVSVNVPLDEHEARARDAIAQALARR